MFHPIFVGLGNGYFAVVLAEVSHGTTTEERTSVVSAIMAMRQFGLLLGLFKDFHHEHPWFVIQSSDFISI